MWFNPTLQNFFKTVMMIACFLVLIMHWKVFILFDFKFNRHIWPIGVHGQSYMYPCSDCVWNFFVFCTCAQTCMRALLYDWLGIVIGGNKTRLFLKRSIEPSSDYNPQSYVMPEWAPGKPSQIHWFTVDENIWWVFFKSLSFHSNVFFPLLYFNFTIPYYMVMPDIIM